MTAFSKLKPGLTKEVTNRLKRQRRRRNARIVKQEIWKWCSGLLVNTQPNDALRTHGYVAALYREGEFVYSWRTWGSPLIGGVSLSVDSGFSFFFDGAKMAASKEIKRQLATKGVRCEIRKAKK